MPAKIIPITRKIYIPFVGRHLRVHWSVIPISFLLYIVCFSIITQLTGKMLGSYFTLIPAIAMGWASGILGGLLAGVIIFPINSLLKIIFKPEPAAAIATILGYLTVFIIGGAFGYVSNLYHRLQKTLGEVKLLRGLLPICTHCKSIRDDEGRWHSMEDYFRMTSRAKLRKVICPKCAQKIYPKIGLDNDQQE